jgi:ADP-ribosyl-[dinitrogen reductase] hydrolase
MDAGLYSLYPRLWCCGGSECILRVLHEQGMVPVADPGVYEEILPLDGVSVARLLEAHLGVALGDALGSTIEFTHIRVKSKMRIREELPPGSFITDDTQLTFWGLEVLLRRGWLDPELVAERYSREPIIGIGITMSTFLTGYKEEGLPWFHANVPSAGNGAVMKLPPALLSGYLNNGKLAAESILYTLVIYRDPAALAAAYATSRLAWLLASNRLSLEDSERLLSEYVEAHRRVEGDSTRYRLADLEGPSWELIEKSVRRASEAGMTPLEFTLTFGSSAYLVETMAFVLYNFSYWAGRAGPWEILASAATNGEDSDTTAAVTGMLLAAAKGLDAFPQRPLSQLLEQVLPRQFYKLYVEAKGLFAGPGEGG